MKSYARGALLRATSAADFLLSSPRPYDHEGNTGDKLFLSRHTISTDRRNILKKSGKSSIGEVIYELESIGMI